MDFKANLQELLEGTKAASNEIAIYATEQAVKLSQLVDQPGYAEAVIAARDSIALRAGIAASDTADASDSRILGILEGALFMGAKALVI